MPDFSTFSCPGCGAHLKRSAAIPTGALVKCPRCSREFRVPPEESSSPGYLSQVPAAGPGLGPEEGAPIRSRIEVSELMSGSQPVDVGAWMGAARKRYSELLGPAIGFTLIVAVLLIPISVVIELGITPLLAGSPGARFLFAQLIGGLLGVLLVQPLLLGAPYAAARLLRGESWSFGDFFAGFTRYDQVVLCTFLTSLVVGVIELPILASYAYSLKVVMTIVGPIVTVDPERLLATMIPAMFVCLPVLIFVSIRWSFALLLIIDQKMSALEGLKASWRITEGKVLGLFGYFLLLTLILLGGVLACGIGILFALPFVLLGWSSAYLHLTGQQSRLAVRIPSGFDDLGRGPHEPSGYRPGGR